MKVWIVYNTSIASEPSHDSPYIYGIFLNIEAAIRAKKSSIEWNRKFGSGRNLKNRTWITGHRVNEEE